MAILIAILALNGFVMGWNRDADPIAKELGALWPFSWSPRDIFRQRRGVIGGGSGAAIITSHQHTLILLNHLASAAQTRHPPADGSPDDPTGQTTLDVGTYEDRDPNGPWTTTGIAWRRQLGHRCGPAWDAWGRTFLYRSPGPCHGGGWDVYSVGPNGIDERGAGDDLLVGENVTPGGTGGQ